MIKYDLFCTSSIREEYMKYNSGKNFSNKNIKLEPSTSELA